MPCNNVRNLSKEKVTNTFSMDNKPVLNPKAQMMNMYLVCNDRCYLGVGLQNIQAPRVQDNLATRHAASLESLVSDNDSGPVEAVEMRRLPTCRFRVLPPLEVPDDEAPADDSDEMAGDDVHPDALRAEWVEDVGGAVRPHGVAERAAADPALVLGGAGDEVEAAGVGHGLDVSSAERDRRAAGGESRSSRSGLPPPANVRLRCMPGTVFVPVEWQRSLLGKDFLSDRVHHLRSPPRGREAEEGGRLAAEQTGDDGAHHVQAGTALCL